MIAIPTPSARGPVRAVALVCVLALGASACGLSAELDRERNPERTPTPTPTRTTPAPAPAPSPVETAPPPVPSATAPHVPVQQARGCPASGVRIDPGPIDGAMGLRAMSLVLTNCGEHPHTLNGYPAVTVLDETGAPIPGVRTVRGTEEVPVAPADPGPGPLTLAPGDTARAGLYWRMAAEPGPYLRVAPETGQKTRNVHLTDPLDIGPENVLGTTPWQATKDG
ncbi:DUF4232 domain-containing protein [Streptomyces sp. NPDC008313]|uniref:DUF4232 domain-containing protein n=1 Tax=Streptomyces sp. NPDC008313 TaxID=3364826 RepID=UPI0036E56E3B